jgi:hypothetical protein
MVVEGKRRLEGSIWKHKILSSESNWKEKKKTHIVVQMNDGQEVLRDDKLFKHVTNGPRGFTVAPKKLFF